MCACVWVGGRWCSAPGFCILFVPGNVVAGEGCHVGCRGQGGARERWAELLLQPWEGREGACLLLLAPSGKPSLCSLTLPYQSRGPGLVGGSCEEQEGPRDVPQI